MAATYDFKDLYEGNTFSGKHLTLKKDGVAMDLSGAEVIMELVSKGTVVKSMEITVFDGLGGVIYIEPQEINLRPLPYRYHITIKHNNTTKTYLVGNFPVVSKTDI